MTDPPYTGPKMEARRSAEGYVVEAPREVEVDEKARVYGSRWVVVETADGGTKVEEVPLFWEDLLDPQEGDHVPHGEEHSEVISDTQDMLRALFAARGRDDVKVYDDMKMYWADPSVPKVSPDIAVIFGVKNPERRRESFDEKKEGTRPSFVLEVTSTWTAHLDRGDKPGFYRQAKVREYLVVDRLKTPWTLSGYRLDAKGRQCALRPDKSGRYLAKTLEVFFSIGEGGKGLVLQDAKTSEVLVPPRVGREAAEQRADEADDARRQEALARQAAERRAAEEADARRQEALARQAAERRAAEEADARRQEALARQAAEAKLEELQAEIERLKGSGG